MTKNRRISSPAKRLQTILPAREKFQRVPARDSARRNAVESIYHQLRAVESAAYGLVANMSSLPVRMSNQPSLSPSGFLPLSIVSLLRLKIMLVKAIGRYGVFTPCLIGRA